MNPVNNKMKGTGGMVMAEKNPFRDSLLDALHNSYIDTLPWLRLPEDYRELSETILGVVQTSPPGAVFLYFKKPRQSGEAEFRLWKSVPNNPREVKRTLRTLAGRGFTQVCDGGVHLADVDLPPQYREWMRTKLDYMKDVPAEIAVSTRVTVAR